jgi:hypothetical protein
MSILTEPIFKVSKRAKVIMSILFFAAIFGGGYWFLMHTARGGSLALYAIGGRGAPAALHLACAEEADPRVNSKFELPLAFDEATKDQLKGFWYYSYFRECLFENGYDFKGNTVAPSTITAKGEVSFYENKYMGFSALVPAHTTLALDNALNVDFDDSLFFSLLRIDSGKAAIEAYTKRDPFTSFDTLRDQYVMNPLTKTPIVDIATRTSIHNVQMLYITEANASTRLVFMGTNGRVISISTKDIPAQTLEAIASTISVF